MLFIEIRTDNFPFKEEKLDPNKPICFINIYFIVFIIYILFHSFHGGFAVLGILKFAQISGVVMDRWGSSGN